MIPQLVINNLTFSFNKDKKLFSKFNLTLPNVPIIGIVGKNGIGKTVLAEILIGKFKKVQGKILLSGKDISNLPTSKRSKKINLSFQNSSFAFFKETVLEEVLLTIENKKKTMEKEAKASYAKKLLKKFNLNEKIHNSPITLSGGEKRLLSFLILDIINPDVTIYDEPTIGLDKTEKQEFKKLILERVTQNKRTLIISHDINFLAKVTNYMVLIDQNQYSKNPEVVFIGKILDFYCSGVNENYKFLPNLNIFARFKSIIEKNNENDLKKFLEISSDYEVFKHLKNT